MVLLHSDSFQDNTGLDVHVRTTMMQDGLSYSYIEAAAIRVGSTILEFHPSFFRVNGIHHDYELSSRFEFEEKDHTYEFFSSKTGTNKRETIIKLSPASSIKIRSTKNLMYVNFEGNKLDFGDSIGMLGSYPNGEMVGREGSFEGDYVSYGMEWQVDPGKKDPLLFAEDRAPQLPYERCRLPVQSATTSRRRLRVNTDSEMREKAFEACQNAKTDIELCVDDVLATGDLDTAEMFVGMA